MAIEWIPARKITPKEQGNRGLFASNKVPGGIGEFESELERDFLLLCCHDPSVRKFQHQPVSIAYKDDRGYEKKYTPDVYVEYTSGGNVLYEIKYSEEVIQNRAKYQARWNEATRWGKGRGISFSVITEKEIRTPRWENVWFTLGPSKCVSNDQYVYRLTRLIPEDGVCYNSLCSLLAEDLGFPIGKAAQVLCYAIYHGLVLVDTFSTRLISAGSVIRKRQLRDVSPFRPLWEDLKGANSFEHAGEFDASPAASQALLSPEVMIKYDERVLRREKIVKLWLAQPSTRRSSEWRANFSNSWGVPPRTIYRWVQSYEQDGINGLVPKHGRAGRSPKFEGVMLELANQATSDYLQPLVTLKNAYRKLERSCQEHHLPPPSLATFRRHVHRHVTAAEFARKRGNRYYKANYTPSLSSYQGAWYPMQVLQVDNTSLDVFPVDSEGRDPLPAPFLTAAIDCYTRMITGFGVSLFPSSSRSVLEVLVRSILPKKHDGGTSTPRQEWPAQGFPVVILVDNGMDYRAENLRAFCLEHDVILEYVPLRTPRYKAFIEDWFNLLHKALEDEQVPGARPLLKHRLENPDLKPELSAVLTLQDIETWLLMWIVEDYHLTNPYGDHVPAPVLRWGDAKDGRSPVILPSPRDPPSASQDVNRLNLSTLAKLPRTLNSRGITWAHLHYNSRALSEIFNATGKRLVDVLLDSHDIRQVWVVNPLTNATLEVGLGSGWAQAIAQVFGDRPVNASAWKRDVRALRWKTKERITPYLYLKEASKAQRERLAQGAKAATRTARKEQEKAKEAARSNPRNRIVGLQPVDDAGTPQPTPAGGHPKRGEENEADHYEPKKHTYELSHKGGIPR